MDISKTSEVVRKLSLKNLKAELEKTLEEIKYSSAMNIKTAEAKEKFSSSDGCSKKSTNPLSISRHYIRDKLAEEKSKNSMESELNCSKNILNISKEKNKYLPKINPNTIFYDLQGKKTQKNLKIKLRSNIAGWFSQVHGGDRNIVSGLTGSDFEVITGQKRFGRGLDINGAIKHIRRLSGMVGAKLIVCGNIKVSPTLIIKERSNILIGRRYILGYVNNIEELSLILGSESIDIDSMSSRIRSTLFRFDASINVTDNVVSVSAGNDNYEFKFPFHPKILFAALDEMENYESIDS